MPDLLSGLAAIMADRPNVEGMTTQEIAEARGWSPARVKEALRVAQRAGKLQCARSYRPAIDGCLRPVPVYRMQG